MAKNIELVQPDEELEVLEGITDDEVEQLLGEGVLESSEGPAKQAKQSPAAIMRIKVAERDRVCALVDSRKMTGEEYVQWSLKNHGFMDSSCRGGKKKNPGVNGNGDGMIDGTPWF